MARMSGRACTGEEAGLSPADLGLLADTVEELLPAGPDDARTPGLVVRLRSIVAAVRAEQACE
jgi:hypothetical protein